MHLLISRQDGRAHWDCEPLTAEDHACGILSSKLPRRGRRTTIDVSFEKLRVSPQGILEPLIPSALTNPSKLCILFHVVIVGT